MDIFWEIYQNVRISETERKADEARSQAREGEFTQTRLQRQCDGLMLTCQAMWELLRESGTLTDEQLAAKIREVDLRDGKLDGRYVEPKLRMTVCPACQRTTSTERKTCLYCGGELPGGTPFK